MVLATYAIVAVGSRWGILHDGNVEGDHATQEFAFEAAIAAASRRSAKDMRFMSAYRDAMQGTGPRPGRKTDLPAGAEVVPGCAP